MQWTDNIRIETPEQIDVSLELAGLASRFVARLLDWAIKWAICIPACIVLAVVVGLVGLEPALILTLLISLGYFFFFGYDIYYEVRHNGQTPGKKWAGIRVIREGGAPLDFRSACIRNLLGLADFLPAFYLLGALLVALTVRKQRLGDLAAGTMVIRERVVQAPADVAKEVERLASDEFVFTAEQLAPCFPEGRHILRSFFQRYQELEADPRQQLACRLAEEFVGKTSYQPAAPIAGHRRALTFLASLYRDIEKLNRHGR